MGLACRSRHGSHLQRCRAQPAAQLAGTGRHERLAREIHDTLAQGLTAIALQIETAIENVGSDPKRVRERLEKALATARENLDEARRSVTNLRAGALAGKPLAQALASLAREFTSDSGIRVTFEPRGNCALALPVEAELYRIAEQALTNVRQHANAKSVRAALVCTARGTTLTIEDDGAGFDVRRVPAERHGIEGMRERARIAGGTLTISSRRGKGTKIVVKL